jgi:hypothetical protein
MHKATLTLPSTSLQVTLGMVPVTMLCAPFDVEVDYRFKAGLPASAEGPAEANTFAVQSVRLARSLAMHDATDTMSLVFSGQTDLLPYLSVRTLDWIEEHLPVPSE